jgi:tungstate transport system substrate-binding protein
MSLLAKRSAAVALFGLLLAACGGATPPPSSSSSESVAASVASSAVPPASSSASPGASVAASVASSAVPRSNDPKSIILATTTSTQDSGLLDVLVPLFEKQGGWQVKTVAVGTGAALALGARAEADVVLVHAPEAEKKWFADGNGTERLLVMHNDFIVIGPDSDPARVKGDKSALDALKQIAAKQATWISRDDASGTDQLEKQLWQDAGLNPKGNGWYVTSGQGMGATLTVADQKNAYTISDRATYLARKSTIGSTIMVEKDPVLLNIYHVMPVNPAKFPNVKINASGGRAFADFMVASDTQKVIGSFGLDKYGQALFFADAGKDESTLAV